MRAYVQKKRKCQDEYIFYTCLVKKLHIHINKEIAIDFSQNRKMFLFLFGIGFKRCKKQKQKERKYGGGVHNKID